MICQFCGEEIDESEYALPLDNMDNVCHNECVVDWFEENAEDIASSCTTYIKNY